MGTTRPPAKNPRNRSGFMMRARAKLTLTWRSKFGFSVIDVDGIIWHNVGIIRLGLSRRSKSCVLKEYSENRHIKTFKPDVLCDASAVSLCLFGVGQRFHPHAAAGLLQLQRLKGYVLDTLVVRIVWKKNIPFPHGPSRHPLPALVDLRPATPCSPSLQWIL